MASGLVHIWFIPFTVIEWICYECFVRDRDAALCSLVSWGLLTSMIMQIHGDVRFGDVCMKLIRFIYRGYECSKTTGEVLRYIGTTVCC